ncbi:MAG: beta-ketoacyl-ACP synthase II [Tissierellia bacterium]|nr:beta-ketoacyl-ACP synthase II [Tissierellia bacterium]
MNRRRVVVTGLGAVSPIGNTLEDILNSIRTSRSGIDFIENFDTKDFQVKLAGEVKDLDFEIYIDKKSLRRMDRVNSFGLVAGIKSVEDSGLDLEKVDRDRVGVYISSGIGGLQTIEEQKMRGMKSGYERVSPFFIPMSIVNMIAYHVASHFGFHGSCICPVTACAGSNSAIGEGYRSIKDGYSDMVLAGGAEASITPLGTGGFSSMKALSRADDRERASIPFDKERSGFVMGEGAGVLVLEELEHAKSRNARIYGEIIGYGSTCDAGHITQPNSEGIYAAKAMENAILEGGIDREQVNYINAHGTSTPLNDKYETVAIKRVFGEGYRDISVSSTKSMTGHLLGASGAVEAIVTLVSMMNGIVPPNINYRIKDEECDLNIVENRYRDEEVNYAISNSLGFGGHNVSILFKRWEG